MFFADKSDVKILAMSVEDGLKLVISMGLVFPDKPLPPALETAAAEFLPAKETARKKRASRRKAT